MTQQVVKVTGDVWVEPNTGWPMGKTNQLYLSLYPSGVSPYMPVPAYKTIWQKKPVVALDKIISLRDVNEAGYSHFYTDLMAKLVLIEQAGCNLKDYTVVISKKVAQTACAKFLIEHSPLFSKTGHFFLQEDEFVTAKEAIFSNVFINPTCSPIFKQVAEYAKAAHPIAGKTANRKVFLTRGKNRRRTMRNNVEIIAILKNKAFEIVDTDNLSLPQQIELFAQCRYLVGIHGAGLANMLYRFPHKLSLFEIHEPLRPILGINPIYHNMSAAFGFDYGVVTGEDFDSAANNFYMPGEKFEAAFNAFWAKFGE